MSPDAGHRARGDTEPIYRLKAEFFRLLGHPARVRILELLREGEQSVGSLQSALELDSSGTSQHLTAMRRQGLLESRRAGTSVFYRVKDPRIFQLLEVAKQILTGRLEETRDLLGDLAADEPQARRAGTEAAARNR
ncbi:MAG TPA: metalloregulator ArsR/SmtB family transcription factor [Solirubrobacteraceae bacterium]|jgi:ArsR family transcriptional regulator|nr:metalloregulator ArsR/SmtB family transcription factor [Solirubrobacteraceae bacterium]